MDALCTTAAALGIDSLRAPCLALRAARAAAALAGRAEVDAEDAALAARLVLAPRATRLPEAPAEADAEADPPEPNSPTRPPPATRTASPDPVEARSRTGVLEAAQAAIPPGLLAAVAGAGRAAPARQAAAGALHRGGQRGRPAGVRAGDPRAGPAAEPDRDPARRGAVAAPARRRRRPAGAAAPTDFRVTHLQQRAETTTIFVVDASGSPALNRLAEAKGAVELLLAECYVRRDQVAVLAFRGRGGATAAAADALAGAGQALAWPGCPAVAAHRSPRGSRPGPRWRTRCGARGGTPTVVLLTDGRANVTLDGRAAVPAPRRTRPLGRGCGRREWRCC